MKLPFLGESQWNPEAISDSVILLDPIRCRVLQAYWGPVVEPGLLTEVQRAIVCDGLLIHSCHLLGKAPKKISDTKQTFAGFKWDHNLGNPLKNFLNYVANQRNTGIRDQGDRIIPQGIYQGRTGGTKIEAKSCHWAQHRMNPIRTNYALTIGKPFRNPTDSFFDRKRLQMNKLPIKAK